MENIKEYINIKEKQLANKEEDFYNKQKQEINVLISDFLNKFHVTDIIKKYILNINKNEIKNFNYNFNSIKGHKVHSFVDFDNKTISYIFKEEKKNWQLIKRGYIFMIKNDKLICKNLEEYYYYDDFEGYIFYEESIKNETTISEFALYDITKWIVMNNYN